MRRARLLAVAAVLVAPAPGGHAAGPGPGGFASENVTWVANIPVDSPGVGAKVLQVGAQTRLYVTGVKGLTIYDVTNPAVPVPLGATALPHWENEEVQVSADGSIVLVPVDAGPGGTFVVDTSIVTAPRVVARFARGSHTVACATPSCAYVYASDGWTMDLRQPTSPVEVTPGWADVVETQGVNLRQGAHNLNLDAAGLIVTDTVPRVVLDPRRNAAAPKVLATGDPGGLDLAYQHNNVRPRAAAWRPRAAGDTSPALRPGELLLANGETNATVSCDGSTNGPFATWSMRDFDKGARLRPLDVFRPLQNGSYADSNPAVNVLGCSGHWFTERNNVVAAAWYEHGTRFLEVDPRTGKIKEVGYYQPVTGSTSAAHWLGDDYVLTVDYTRGIDILEFDRGAPAPSQSELDANWLASAADRTPGRTTFRTREAVVCRAESRAS